MVGTYASGRYRTSRRTKAERCLALDVNQLKRAGCLRAGWEGSSEWRYADEQLAAIDLCFRGDLLHLAYNVRICGVLEDVAEAICIVRAPCRFGGSRPYFIC